MPKIITTKSFIFKSEKIHKNKYDYSKVFYLKNNLKIEIICNIHGSFFQTPAVHLRGGGCILCILKKSSDKYSKGKEKFIIDSKNIHGDKYSYEDVNYINNKTPVKIKCNLHGYFFQQPRSHILGKSGCPRCANKNITTDIFIEKCKNVFGDYYDYSFVMYKNSNEKIKIVCPKNHTFFSTPNNHLNGRGCPICKESLGERIISNYLTDKNIFFIRQYKFKDCKFKRCLSFDFYLSKLNILIEYDGEQHFKKYRFEKNNDILNERIIKDNIKDNYCINNNILLLRINYKENIHLKLNDFFKKKSIDFYL
jgi:very-short-patch-repair endonuclease